MATQFVPAGASLQAALDAAAAHDLVQFDSGAVFSGVFTLPAKTGPVTLRGPATLISAVINQPVLRTAPAAHHWQLQDFTAQGRGAGEVVRLGSTNQTLDEVPRHLSLDRLTVQGHPVFGIQRGIALNSAQTALRHVTVRDVFLPGVETQAICGWNTPGQVLIEHCDLQAGSIGIMFGGEPPRIDQLVPTGIVIRHNHIHRPLHWRTLPYNCKNFFELKNAADVVFADNLLEHNWLQGQAGHAITLTPRASLSGTYTAPWSRVSDVLITRNTIRGSGSGINMLGTDTSRPSGRLTGVRIVGNAFLDIDRTRWGGHGTFLQLTNMPHGVEVLDNTVLNTGGHAVFVDSGPGSRDPVLDFVFAGNVVRSGTLRGNGVATALQTATIYLPGADITDNIFGGEVERERLPDNDYISSAAIDARYCFPTQAAEMSPSWRG